MLRQFRAWLGGESDTRRTEFFTHGLIVLDSNALLSLYEYTPKAREEVLAALRRVKPRLWLPHQVGLEFVRGRHRVLDSRAKALKAAPGAVNQKIGEARQAVLAARRQVQDLLMRYGRDQAAADALGTSISDKAIDNLLAAWREELLTHIQDLKTHDLKPSTLGVDDLVLQSVAELFGERIAPHPGSEAIRRRVEEAASYRYPNRIPPGFSDRDKDTPLRSAGDYLLWEEVIEHAGIGAHTRVLFVSADTKDDWYEPAEPGRGPRPWPLLAEELHMRSGAELRVETPQQFFAGVEHFLGANLDEATFQEINRVVEVPTQLRLLQEAIEYGHQDLRRFLEASARPLGDVYRTGTSWTQILRRAGLAEGPVSEDETALLRRVPSFLHVDDPSRLTAYRTLLGDDLPPYAQLEPDVQAYARMLLFNLWPLAKFDTYQEGLDTLQALRAVRHELRDVLALGRPSRVAGPQLRLPEAGALPLHIHASYTREEILTGLGESELRGRLPGHFREGAKWCRNLNADALFITVDKEPINASLFADEGPSAGGQHGDFALSTSLFCWDSPTRTTAGSPTGIRYRSPASHVLLFVRRHRRSITGAAEPWVLLGPADYVEHQGDRPMSVLWKLHQELPEDVWAYAARE
ncbi:DUF3427 domain-containing protein [Streptomyces sp. NPDC000594]|uniref:DUF3427 domain-containing protein n=1 Tax=Streptomyces sp. NPDC000594 TaxID=3154261 RepID=UPI00331FD91D